jgi:hypothetical protein
LKFEKKVDEKSGKLQTSCPFSYSRKISISVKPNKLTGEIHVKVIRRRRRRRKRN